MLSFLVLVSASEVHAIKRMTTNLTDKAKAVIQSQLSPEELKQSARSAVLPTKKKNANAVLQRVQKQAVKVRVPKKRAAVVPAE